MRADGLDVTVCLVPDDPDIAERIVRRVSLDRRFDVIEIGSGLRTSHEYTTVFERVINTLVTLQSGVRLCFNDSPETTLAAVRRGLGR